jgi:hypothetical protein
MSDSAVKERREFPFEIQTGALVTSGAMDWNDPNDVRAKLQQIVERVQMPLNAQIEKLTKENETLKARTFSNTEIQRLSDALRNSPNEYGADGRPTSDVLLLDKLTKLSRGG